MRVFVAAELPFELHAALAETSALLRASVRGRYVAPDSFHVTLAFLGEVEAGLVDSVAAAVDQGCMGIPAFQAALGDLGSFGKGRKTTLWQGFTSESAQQLSELANAVRASLAREGFSFDSKKFLPHITLMRAVDPSSGMLPLPIRAEGLIDTMSVFRSDLSGEGPVYEALYSSILQ